jgi:L-fuconate dehydratase
VDITITAVDVADVRFPTSRTLAGSDAMNEAPDYSAAYVTLSTDTDLSGYGMTFTIGRGTEIVCQAVRALAPLVVGQNLTGIRADPGRFGLPPSQSARHWSGAGRPELALASAVEAQAVAQAVAAHQDVIDMGRLAIDLWPEVSDAAVVAGSDRVRVLESIADAELCLGRPAEAVDALRTALEELPSGTRAMR